MRLESIGAKFRTFNPHCKIKGRAQPVRESARISSISGNSFEHLQRDKSFVTTSNVDGKH